MTLYYLLKTFFGDFFLNIGRTIVIAIKNVFWWITDTLIELFIIFIDWVAKLLPDYTIPVPSVFFGQSQTLVALNWIFPVDLFMACLGIIVVNMGIVFAVGPLLRIVRISR